MIEILTPDVCVIGGGVAGLSVAAGASRLGFYVVLVDGGGLGGNSLNTGCIPSKALIAAAKAAQAQRSSTAFGIAAVEPAVDFARVMDHVAGVIAAIALDVSVERLESLYVRVLKEDVFFTGRNEVQGAGYCIRSRRIVVATGSRPAIPPIPGLADAPYLTSETVFENRTLPRHLIVIGGGPTGLELAQAHRRLGAEVTVLEAETFLSNDDPELSAIVLQCVRDEGVRLRDHARIARVEQTSVVLEDGERIEGSHLLVAAGRTPNIGDLDLHKAGIDHTTRGITVDASLRTTNRGVWAIGDCNGLHRFTHMAGYQASLFVRGAMFRLPARLDPAIVSWAVYTDPELAQVGVSEAEARARHGDSIKVLRWNLSANDRAQTERATEGMVKAIVTRRGRVLGAAIVAPGAGELIQPWCLAISERLNIAAMASFVPPYPTLGEVSKRAAGSYFSEKLLGPYRIKLARYLKRLPIW